MSHLTFCANDGHFGPVSACRAFDFTLRFESSILSLLPNAIFQVTAVGLIAFFFLSRRRYIQIATDRSACVHHRDGGSIALSLLHLALMVALLTLAPRLLPGVTTASGFETLVMPSLALETFSALIILCALSFHRPERSTPIVTLINTFLLFSSLFAAVQLRTLYFVPAARTSAYLPVFAADFASRWLLFITTSTKTFHPRQTAEERASFVSKIFFFYLLPSLWEGAKRPIELNDTEPLSHSYSSRLLEAKLFREWHASAGSQQSVPDDQDGDSTSFSADVKSADTEEIAFSNLSLLRTRPVSFLPKDTAAQPKLVHASVRAFAGILFSPLPAKALYTIMVLLQPLLVQKTLDFIASYSDASRQPQPAAYGFGIVGAFALVYLLIALSSGHFTFSIYKTTCKLRGALVFAVYRKALVLSVDALQDADTPSPTVMQSVDIERIVGGLDPFHEIWSGVVTIIVALYLLWQQIGTSFIATIITLATLFASIPLMTKDASAHQKQWSQLTDERTSLIAAAIKAIKAVKQSALEGFLISKITSIRQREVEALIQYAKDVLFISLLGNVAGDILLLATITTFAIVSAYHHHTTGEFPFTTSSVFTTITIVRIIERPLFIIGRRYASVISSVTSLKRLETYLLLPEQISAHHDAALSSSDEMAHLAGTSAAIFDQASMTWEGSVLASPASLETSTGDADSQKSTQQSKKGGGEPVLRDLNLILPRNAVIAAVGEVGCGKSSFLCSLLGELSVVQGKVSLPMRAAAIAYVGQEPWTLGEKSIKHNIVFYRPFEEARYQRALVACGLVLDVQQLPKGDETLAKHLSGGQKQRLALCRAVYADAPTYVLDDPLSAVDASTARSINEALFSRRAGLLRGKTVIMATNSVQQMQLADYILQMSIGGTAKMFASEAATISELADKIDTIRRRSAEERESMDANGESSTAAEVRAAASKEPETLENGEEQEGVMTGGIRVSVFRRYFAAAGWWVSLSYPLALLLQTGLQNGQLLWLQAWAKHVSEDSLRGSIGLHIGVLALLVVARFFIYSGSLGIYLYLHCARTALKLHRDEVTGLLRSGADFFLNLNAGRMINRFTQDIYALDYQICTFYANVVFSIIELCFSLVLMALPAPYLLGVMVGMSGLYYTIYRLYIPSSRQLRRLEIATKSSLHSQFNDTSNLQGLLTIRALKMESQFSLATCSLLDTSQRPYYALWTVRVWLQTWLNLVGMLLNTALVLFAVSLRHSSNAGLVAVALIQAVSISADLNGLMASWTELEIGIVSLERIEQLITLPADAKDDARKLKAMPSAAQGSGGPAAAAVRFEDVTAGYSGNESALRKISFSLQPGERLGICGRSGSGKSTLLLALLRILEPGSGSIKIDGVDTATLTGESVRRNISYIPQEPMVLPGLTLRENLDPEGEHSDDEAYWKVLRQTSMFETVSSLAEGLDHALDLQSLSMGQKQLLNVARALLKRRGLLVMDEATSNLDSETDAQIQLALAAASNESGIDDSNLSRTRSKRPVKAVNNDTDDNTGSRSVLGRPTMITIAHRLSTIMDYDKILVLGNGKVLEFGSPSELLQMEKGEFKTMVEEQNRNVD